MALYQKERKKGKSEDDGLIGSLGKKKFTTEKNKKATGKNKKLW